MVCQNTPMTKTAFSYARFSSLKQQHGRSQARQIEACQLYCTTHGLHLAEGDDYRFLDAGVSGWKGDHVAENGQLARFISLVKDGTIKPGSVLIVESLDRLSREQVTTALHRFMGLLEVGIEIVTLIDQKVYRKGGSDMDLILSIFIMSRANEESTTKSKRVRDAYAKKHQLARTENKPMGNAVPLWLSLSPDKKEYVLQPERAALVKRIYQLAIDGYGRIATSKLFNSEGIPSFKGGIWSTTSIDNVLSNRAVLGEYQPYSVQVDGSDTRQKSGLPIEGYFPAVIDKPTFYAAQAAISGRRISKATKQSNHFNVWQGVAKCSLCGSAMHIAVKGTPSKKYAYLHCYRQIKGLCKNKLIRLDSLEQVFRRILSVLDVRELIQDGSAKIDTDIRDVEARISEQQKRLNEYKALMRVRITDTVYDLIAETDAEIDRLKTQLELLQTALADEKGLSKSNFVARLDLITYEGRNRANNLLKKMGISAYLNKKYTTVLQKSVNGDGIEVQNGIITLAREMGEIELHKGYLSHSPELYECTGYEFTADTAAMILRMEQRFPSFMGVWVDAQGIPLPDHHPEFWRGILAEHEAADHPFHHTNFNQGNL